MHTMRREDRNLEQLRLGEDASAAQLRRAWRNVIQALLPQVAPSSRRFLEATTPEGIEGDCVRLRLDSPLGRDWLQRHHLRHLQELLSQQLGYAVTVQLVGESAERFAEPPPAPVATVSVRAEPNLPPLPPPQFNPHYTFETFVVGVSNRLAHAAAIAVAQGSTRGNPLFIYSPPGLGKTHLLHAIGQTYLRRVPNARVMYLSGEEFVNRYVQAVRQQKTDEFRERCRSVHLWLMDDVQFIAGKERTQEEFFHIFNALHGAGKQLVMTSDKPPRELIGLEERLRTRLEWGLCADIAPPDLETRIAILQCKAERDGVLLPFEIAAFIADKIQSSVRVLEGVLTRLIALCSITGEPMSYELASEAMRAYLVDAPPEKARATIEQVLRLVCEELGVSRDELRGESRRSEIVQARQVAVLLLREATGESWGRIAEAIGRSDHTTVLHAYKQVQQRIKRDSLLRERVQRLRQQMERAS